MSRVSDLVDAYTFKVGMRWQPGVSGGERVWMLPYPPEMDRTIRAAIPSFEAATRTAQRGWRVVDIADAFGRWLAEHEYAEALFEEPEELSPAILGYFEDHIVEHLRAALESAEHNDIVALVGIASVYPFLRASSVIKAADDAVKGRLLVLFPGTHDRDHHAFRLLDARDGFNYRADVIDPQKDLV